MNIRLSQTLEAFIELELVNDQGLYKKIEALVDTGWDGELYLSHSILREMRIKPDLFQQTWFEQNPEPVEGLIQIRQLPTWTGSLSFRDKRIDSVKVHQGLRGQSETARIGRAFLKRFGIILILDLEGQDYQLLARQQP
jgi:hypothetical protein